MDILSWEINADPMSRRVPEYRDREQPENATQLHEVPNPNHFAREESLREEREEEKPWRRSGAGENYEVAREGDFDGGGDGTTALGHRVGRARSQREKNCPSREPRARVISARNGVTRRSLCGTGRVR